MANITPVPTATHIINIVNKDSSNVVDFLCRGLLLVLLLVLVLPITISPPEIKANKYYNFKYYNIY